MPLKALLSSFLSLLLCTTIVAQTAFRIGGRVTDANSGQPVEFATVLMKESGLWAVTGEDGTFTIKNIPQGTATMTVQCLGYRKATMQVAVNANVSGLKLTLQPEDLRLDEVTVVARRKADEATTSYTIGRQTLDQQQLLNIADIATLLPGGKTVNPTLMSDSRLALRSAEQEKGNASFGTAVEVDGVRLDNNAAAGETLGASTRTLSASGVESIEVVTGIPSVEYGDLSNGIVKVNTRRGKSPFIVEGSLNQHTRQMALNKGFDLSRRRGIVNVTAEHARSFSDAASPHTAYQRNIMSLRYSNTFLRDTRPLTLDLSLSANIGGYNSEADPDNELDNYSKARDNALRASLDLRWMPNSRWITNLRLSASYSIADKKSETYTHTSSASTQPYLHATEEGYFMAQQGQDANTVGNASERCSSVGNASERCNIILSPTGYWYVRGYHDSKPTAWAVKLQGEKNGHWHRWRNRLMAGAQLNGSRNNGRGTYYADINVAPTWREYRYDRLPSMNNIALYAEDKLSVPLSKLTLEVTAGLRDDITFIAGSDYGTVSSLSPRVNSRLIVWRSKDRVGNASERCGRWIEELSFHAGIGKSVKLPSFQVLYPQPSYSDLLAFASTSTSDNTSFYAYHTYPARALYNPSLRWQHTVQTDLGADFTIKGTRVSISLFRHKTSRSYTSLRQYTPFTYLYTPPSALNAVAIPVSERTFTIDRQTGVVTVGGEGYEPQKLTATERRTFTTQTTYANATAVRRWGAEWTVDFAQVKALRTALRLDGNYYEYRGLDDLLFADIPLGVSNVTASGQPYQYIGFYRGSSTTTAGTTASASPSNGALQRQANINATLTTHIPALRLVIALRGELSLLNYRRALSELPGGGSRGIAIDDKSDLFGTEYSSSMRDQLVALYPDFYSTWENPTELLPFAEHFLWARDNDAQLYSDLSQLVVHTNYPYTLNPNRLSRYYSANISVTKEIGDNISVSFYANNFWNNMKRIHSSQTNTDTSLFGSGHIPSYYYGLSLRLKI